MSSVIYDKEEFFLTLEKLAAKDTIEVQNDDQSYVLKTTQKNIDFGKTISISVQENEVDLFIFSMTYYDKEKFIKTVKQPFKWDTSDAERYEDSEFGDFLHEKGLSQYPPYEITVLKNGTLLKDSGLNSSNDENKIDALLDSVDFKYLAEYALRQANKSSFKKPIFNESNVDKSNSSKLKM